MWFEICPFLAANTANLSSALHGSVHLGRIMAMLFVFLLSAGAARATRDVNIAFIPNGLATLGSRSFDLDGRGGYVKGEILPNGAVRVEECEGIVANLLRAQEFGKYTLILDVLKNGAKGLAKFDPALINLDLPLSLAIGDINGAPLTSPTRITSNFSGALTYNGTALLVAPRVAIEATGNQEIDAFFGLPGPLNMEIAVRVDIPDGWQTKDCADPSVEATEFHYWITDKSHLTVSAAETLGGKLEFWMDASIGRRRGGSFGTMSPIRSDGTADILVRVEDMEIAPFNFIASAANISLDVGIIWMEVQLLEDLRGTIDFCSGTVTMYMNSTFTPRLWGDIGPDMNSMEVVTDLTTESLKGYTESVKGTKLDDFGSSVLVGLSPQDATGEAFYDWFLGLPGDTVTTQPTSFSFGCRGVREIRSRLGSQICGNERMQVTS